MMSPAVRRQRADVSLVARPRDPLQLRLLQQWCITPTATVWRIQALVPRTVARGIVDQRLLRRRTGARQLRRDKAYIKRHPAADMLCGGLTDKPGKRLPVSLTCELKATYRELKSDARGSDRGETWGDGERAISVCSVSPPLHTSHLQSA